MSVIFNSIENTKSGFINISVDGIVRYDVCRLIIKIEDSGIGMDIDKVNSILDDNRELTIEETEKLNKLDMDLMATIKSLKLLGGSFNIKSEKNKGSIFTIVLDQKCDINQKTDIMKNVEKYSSDFFEKKRVLIVDCDMRRGRLHEIFKVDNDKGLSLLLIDEINEKSTKYFKKTEVPNLFVLPRGIVPPNPSEILSSDKNKKLTEVLEKKFDIVIYDGVPASGLADAIIMADLVDKIVIVSAYKQTKMEQLQNTKKALEKFQDKIAGVVLNKLPEKKNHYYSYYN